MPSSNSILYRDRGAELWDQADELPRPPDDLQDDATRSYRDLPCATSSWARCIGTEVGVLHGLLRVRGFTQDDAHIFCTMEQLTDEIVGVIRFADDMLRVFGFEEYEVFLSTRPEKSIGSDAVWEAATNALVAAMEANDISYEIDEGGGAFYGPKIDIKIGMRSAVSGRVRPSSATSTCPNAST